MVFRKTRKNKSAKRRKHARAKISLFRKNATRKSVKKAGWHRPRVKKVGTKWFRSKKSKLFKSPTMLNPRRRRKVSRRRNPGFNVKSLLNKQRLIEIGSMGAGIGAGFIMLPVIYNMIPAANRAKVDKYLGLGNVAVGILLATFVKNKMAKSAGVMIAATGAYDLLAQFTSQYLGLPIIPRSNIIANKVGGSSVAAPASAPAVGMSYSSSPLISSAAAMAASYELPSGVPQVVGMHGDNPYGDVQW